MKNYLGCVLKLYILTNVLIFSGSIYAKTTGKEINKEIRGYCGDGIINGNEQCDGEAVSIANCEVLGGGVGVVKCQSNCIFDISACVVPAPVFIPIGPPHYSGRDDVVNVGFCGDGILNGWEECDGASMIHTECNDFRGGEGKLKCQPSCLYDISDCSLVNAIAR